MTTIRTPEKWAVLIGINCYLRPDAPSRRATYGNLEGCVSDVNCMEDYLTTVHQLPADHITKLTSTPSSADKYKPSEAAEQLPTYENIIAAFEDITQAAQSGDFVYLHYAGHGARAVTLFPHLKTNGFDEGLVPYNIRDGGRYFRDFEFAALLSAMVKRELIVTVVLDSCHAGGAVRAPELGTPRATGVPDMEQFKSDEQTKFSTDAWEQQQRDATSGRPTWLLRGAGYEVLAAARAHEVARERCVGPEMCAEGRRVGLLSHWLLHTLKNLDTSSASHEMLYRRIYDRFYDEDFDQTPVMIGDGQRVFLGSNRVRQIPTVRVHKRSKAVTSDDDPEEDLEDEVTPSVEIDAGLAHGAQVGAEYAVYKWNDMDLDKAFCRVVIKEVKQLVSLAAVVGEVNQWPHGSHAVLLTNPQAEKKLKLLSTPSETLNTEKYRYGWVPLRFLDETSTESPDYSVAKLEDEYELCDGQGNAIFGVPRSPSLDIIFRRAVQVDIFNSLLKIKKAHTLGEPDSPSTLKFFQLPSGCAPFRLLDPLASG
jgi:hypothetical protein